MPDGGSDRLVVYTIGHSTLPAERFLDRLAAHGIRRLADVRTVPRSRRHPQFEKARLADLLASRGILYRHFPELGGLRRARRDSVNTAWQTPGFRGYADHMQTPAFEVGLAALLDYAAPEPTAIMCAEAVWWRCHRALLADALVARGVEVRHILSERDVRAHRLSDFARVESGRVTYPGLFTGRDAP